jgi:hypothetical protein
MPGRTPLIKIFARCLGFILSLLLNTDLNRLCLPGNITYGVGFNDHMHCKPQSFVKVTVPESAHQFFLLASDSV